MIAGIILISGKVKIPKYLGKLSLLLFTLSILISGIKSAYITTFFLVLFFLFKKYNLLKILLSSILIFIVMFIIDGLFNSVIYDLTYKIITHDINILIKHFLEVPKILLEDYLYVFLLGGQVGMEGFLYSEVYLITLIYYIGFFGLLFLFVLPILYTFFKGKTFYIQSITIVFALSLVHYYVFRTSFNIFGTTLFYFYFFTLYFKRYLSK